MEQVTESHASQKSCLHSILSFPTFRHYISWNSLSLWIFSPFLSQDFFKFIFTLNALLNLFIVHLSTWCQFSSIKSLSHVWLWQQHGVQHARLPSLSPTPRACSNSYPLSQWFHPIISSSVVPFSSCFQSFPASGSFQMSQLFASGGQSIGVSASTSVLPMNIQDWFSLGWTGWISLQSKGLSRVFSNTTVQKHQFFGAQLSSQSKSHIHTWLLEKPQLWLYGPLLAK